MDEVREENAKIFVNTEYNETFVEVLETIRNQLFDLEDYLKNKANNSDELEYVSSTRTYVEQQLLGYKMLYGSGDNGLKR